MASFDYIDDYFKGSTISENRSDFEQRLLTDTEFAEEVTFYLNTIRVARTASIEDKKNRFQEIYQQHNIQKPQQNIRKLWPYATLVAAALVALFFGAYLYSSSGESAKLADTYIAGNLTTLGVQMGNTKDLFQQGNSLYNDGNYEASLKKFEEVLKSEPSNSLAKENAGVAALKLKQYDKSIQYFSQLSEAKGLTDNTGKFYLALTYMKRNEKGDKEVYTRLLQDIVKDDLYGKEKAAEFLRDLN